jgi:hypothetical protein
LKAYQGKLHLFFEEQRQYPFPQFRENPEHYFSFFSNQFHLTSYRARQMLKNNNFGKRNDNDESSSSFLPPITNQSALSSSSKSANNNNNPPSIASMLNRLNQSPMSVGNPLKRPSGEAAAVPFHGLKSRRKFVASSVPGNVDVAMEEGAAEKTVIEPAGPLLQPSPQATANSLPPSIVQQELPQNLQNVILAKKKKAELATLPPVSKSTPVEKRVVTLAELESNDPFDFIARVTSSNAKNYDSEFVYMMPVKQENGSYNPYHLTLVDYQGIDRNNFFTLSNKVFYQCFKHHIAHYIFTRVLPISSMAWPPLLPSLSGKESLNFSTLSYKSRTLQSTESASVTLPGESLSDPKS